jgi:hypothetical protein
MADTKTCKYMVRVEWLASGSARFTSLLRIEKIDETELFINFTNHSRRRKTGL